MKVVVAQKGAREHFLAARALHDRGALAKLVVDWYSPSGSGFARAISLLLGAAGRSAVAARTDAIPDEQVCALRCFGLWCKWQERRAARDGQLYDAFNRCDAAFGKRVANLNLPSHDAFFGYSYASLEMIEAEKKRGRLTIVDQIDPGALEFRLVAEEMARHPDLAGPPEPFPSGHYDRARREWDLADVIIVNSEWSRAAIIEDGADPAKIEVLPLAYEAGALKLKSRQHRKNEEPLRLLFLGQVNVRKGIYYLLEAARLMQNEAVEFYVAGPVGITQSTVDEAPKNVRWLGPVPRGETSKLYDRCDVFVLPTLSDGFAITQLEALAHGLPVIVTPNCGKVVEDGVTGFLVPPRDSRTLALAISRFIDEPALTVKMSSQCAAAAQAFSIDAYGKLLVEVIERRMSARRRTA